MKKLTLKHMKYWLKVAERCGLKDDDEVECSVVSFAWCGPMKGVISDIAVCGGFEGAHPEAEIWITVESDNNF